MNPEVFAQWLERQGHKVLRTRSSYWFDQGPRVYQAAPFHWLIEPDRDELDHLFKDCGVRALRYSTAWTAPEGSASYHVVYDGKPLIIEELPQKARYNIKKGLRGARIEQISFSRLASEGWKLRAETLQRQHRTRAENPKWWETLCRSADDLLGFEAWGALSGDGKLTAALVAFFCDDCCSILYSQSLTAYLPFRINHALAYSFTNEVLKRPGSYWIFRGIQSLDAPASVDGFKFGLCYAAKPVRQRVAFHPAWRLFINRHSHAFILRLKRITPTIPLLAKAEGMLRFYLGGKLPLEAQHWPLPLVGRKEELIRSSSGVP